MSSVSSVTDTCWNHQCSVWDERGHELIHVKNLGLHQRPRGGQAAQRDDDKSQEKKQIIIRVLLNCYQINDSWVDT